MLLEDVEPYKRRLIAKQRELLDAIARLGVEKRESEEDISSLDVGDKANHSNAKESLFQQGDQDRATLALVEEALRRAADGGFGECEACGQAIEKKRLDAVPWANYCIRCQDRQDGYPRQQSYGGGSSRVAG